MVSKIKVDEIESSQATSTILMETLVKKTQTLTSTSGSFSY